MTLLSKIHDFMKPHPICIPRQPEVIIPLEAIPNDTQKLIVRGALSELEIRVKLLQDEAEVSVRKL
jgi:hypothetical protein